MIDELESLRTLRDAPPPPSDEVRATARAAWDGAPVALTMAPVTPAHTARRFATRAAIAFTAAAALVTTGLVITRNRINSVHPKHVVSVPSLSQPVAAGAPENFLIIGSDSRAFVTTPQQQLQFGSPDVASGQRSDTIVLVRVEPAAHRVFAVSIPRDLLVNVPGCGSMKINATFNPAVTCGSVRGGTQLLVQTITADLNVPVDHVMEIGFAGFSTLVDDLGGIRVNFASPVRDRYTGLNEPAGCQTLNGSQALSFVRSRHIERFVHYWELDPSSIDGDIGRMGREQVGLDALARAALAQAGTDPRPLLRMLFDNVTVDSQFTSDDALRLFDALRTDHAVVTLVLPVLVGEWHGESVLKVSGHTVPDILAGRAPFPTEMAGQSPAQTNESAC